MPAVRRNRKVNPKSGLRHFFRVPILLCKLDLFLLAVLLVSRLFLWILPAGGDGSSPPAAGTSPEVPEWITVDLLDINDYSRPGTHLQQVNGVVIHYVGNPGTTAAQNRSYFSGLARSHETYASSNFLVGLDGEILLCVPMDEVAYCSNSRNDDTLSIEVCHPDDSGHFTQESYDSLVKLVQFLVDSYHLDREDVIRHYDVNGKECPRWFVQDPAAWSAFLDRLQF